MRVHRHLDKADEREALAWIYRIATNYCLNEIRNRKRRPVLHEHPPELAGDDLAAMLADRNLAQRIVENAPEKLRVVAWLHYVDGLEQADVARLLDISRRTVVTRLTEFLENAHRFLQRSAA